MAEFLQIDKLHRAAGDAVDVVFVIRRDNSVPRSAWIANEETRTESGENLDDLVHRALTDYRSKHRSESLVGTLIVDCSR